MKILKRNDECWCGSLKKYKKCHLDIDTKLLSFEKKGYDIPSRKLLLNDKDIQKLRESAVITKGILDKVGEMVKEGTTTDEINSFVHNYTVERNGIPATLGYSGFPKSCCISINEVICHGIPSDRKLKNGDIINVDITTILDGYFSDASRMYTVGEVSEEAQKLVDCAKRCLEIGLEQISPFGLFNDIGEAIEKYANSLGYSVVRDFGGHGIGLNFHEEPHVHHHKTSHKGMVMVPGMVFTIEPMINEGTYKCEVLDDDWTAVTKDNKLSAQFEHTIVITNDGYEIIV